jgi:hypothetical protein
LARWADQKNRESCPFTQGVALVDAHIFWFAIAKTGDWGDYGNVVLRIWGELNQVKEDVG